MSASTNPLIGVATHILEANGCDAAATLNFLVKIRGEKHDVATEAIQYALDNTFSSIVKESSPSPETPASVAVATPVAEEAGPFDGEEIATAVAMEEPAKLVPDATEIRRTLDVLHRGTVELRVPATSQGVWSGYYDDFAALAEDAAELAWLIHQRRES